MIVASFNVRGLGGRLKRNKIKSLLRQHNIDFMAIQETKMESISTSFCASLWGNDDFDWAFLPSEGRHFIYLEEVYGNSILYVYGGRFCRCVFGLGY
jgi:hypothetical protein